MTHILFVPANPERNVEVHEVDEARLFEHATHLTGIDTWDVVTFQHAGFQVLVDDIGYMRETVPPINDRLNEVLVENGRHPGATPIVGDVIVIGIDMAGETQDIPTDLVLEFA